MAFQGSLAELHLPDIIQLISVSGKTGVFHLTDGPHLGKIFLAEGKIVHAEYEEAVGEEAVYALAIWNSGDFRFEPGVATEARTISKNNTNLLMEAARRLDEWRVLSKRIPSTDLIPEFTVLENRDGQINLNTSEWLILSKIDGTHSIKEIAAGTGLSVFDVAKILYGLVTTGLIHLKEPSTPSSPAKAQKASPSPAPAKGAPPPPPAASGESPTQRDLLSKLERIRAACNTHLGSVGESVVNKHYLKAKSDIEGGAGSEAIEDAVHQISRAASILKGPGTTTQLIEHIKSLG